MTKLPLPNPASSKKPNNIAGVILAAGEGSRLRPLTTNCPKCMIPFCGVSMLELTATRLAELPLAGTVVNAAYLADQVADAVSTWNQQHNTTLLLSREAYRLDTGGGIRQAMTLLPADIEHVLVHNADIVLDADLHALLQQHIDSDADATLLLIPHQGVRTVSTAANGMISNFRGEPGSGDATFSGVHVLHRRVLQFLDTAAVCSIITAYERALQAGLRICGISLPEVFWADIGTIPALIDAHCQVQTWPIRYHRRLQQAVVSEYTRRQQLQAQAVTCTGAVSIAESVSVAAGTHLHNLLMFEPHHLPHAGIYAESVITAAPKPADAAAATSIDPRIWQCLGIDADAAELQTLPMQGSGRRYSRICTTEQSWIWCAYDRSRQENGAFAALARFLHNHALAVPKVYLHLADSCQLLLQDLGTRSLHDCANDAELDHYLDQTLAQAARLHSLDPAAARQLPLQPPFSSELYAWEHNYFRQHLLTTLLQQASLWTDAVQAEAAMLSTELQQAPAVLIHRDLQSANVMICAGAPWLIDFQGMRLGCSAYDAASFIYDPYMHYDQQRRQQLHQRYQYWTAHFGAPPCSAELLAMAAVQRLLQALGAFAKLSINDGLSWYAGFIKPALQLLAAAATTAGLTATAEMATACPP